MGGVGARVVAADISPRNIVDHTLAVEAEEICHSCFRARLNENGYRADVHTGGKIVGRYELGLID